MAYAAIRKLSHQPEVIASYERVGVPEERLNLLAITLLVGATGLIVGLLWPPLGVVSAAAVVVYFLAAIGAHVSHDDLESVPTPIVMELLAVGAVTLRVATW